MKKLLNYLTVLLIMLVFQACSDEDSTEPTPGAVTITTNSFTASIDENPNNGDVIGTVSATASDGSALTFSLSAQSVAEALALDANTGELTVADASVFDYETNPTITAAYTASNGTAEATGTINITINDDPDDTAFITTWETTSANESITMPIYDLITTYNYQVDWGDGTTSANQTGEAVHTYANAGTYQVKITGAFPAICMGCSASENRAKIKSIDQWGTIAWEIMESAFQNCDNVVLNATDIPDLSQVENTSYMFQGISAFNKDMSNWDVSNVKLMINMFQGASSFNEDISNWDVSNVTNMNSMFNNATAFNADLSNWDVSSVITMNSMFNNATTFNADLSTWDVVNATNMSKMFNNAAAFNQNLSGWDVDNVTNCSNFAGGTSILSAGNTPNFTNCTP